MDRGSLAGYSPWGQKEWDTTEHTAYICMVLIVLLFKKENKTGIQWRHTHTKVHGQPPAFAGGLCQEIHIFEKEMRQQWPSVSIPCLRF